MLSEMISELRAGYPDREIALKIDGSTTIVGDEPELRSAFSNLVINALKYSEQEILVSWCSSDSSSEFSVIDKGAGIAAKHIPRLTERFYPTKVEAWQVAARAWAWLSSSTLQQPIRQSST